MLLTPADGAADVDGARVTLLEEASSLFFTFLPFPSLLRPKLPFFLLLELLSITLDGALDTDGATVTLLEDDLLMLFPRL